MEITGVNKFIKPMMTFVIEQLDPSVCARTDQLNKQTNKQANKLAMSNLVLF